MTRGPLAAASDSRLSTTAFAAITSERKATSRRGKARSRTTQTVRRPVLRELAEVVGRGGLAGHGDLGSVDVADGGRDDVLAERQQGLGRGVVMDVPASGTEMTATVAASFTCTSIGSSIWPVAGPGVGSRRTPPRTRARRRCRTPRRPPRRRAAREGRLIGRRSHDRDLARHARDAGRPCDPERRERKDHEHAGRGDGGDERPPEHTVEDRAPYAGIAAPLGQAVPEGMLPFSTRSPSQESSAGRRVSEPRPRWRRPGDDRDGCRDRRPAEEEPGERDDDRQTEDENRPAGRGSAASSAAAGPLPAARSSRSRLR